MPCGIDRRYGLGLRVERGCGLRPLDARMGEFGRRIARRRWDERRGPWRIEDVGVSGWARCRRMLR